ncbi:MAG: hypothetical protein H6872_00740 [Methylobacteriaceae bacterium]|nr:hypothetical protein [Methylobacteriaceae bacterium]
MIDDHIAYFDRPGHYLRATLAFKRPFWRDHLPADWWMSDAFDGCCIYDESARNNLERYGMLAFLIAGNAALSLANERRRAHRADVSRRAAGLARRCARSFHRGPHPSLDGLGQRHPRRQAGPPPHRNLHSPSGVAFEVKIACIRALDKDFLPQAAPAVAQTAGSGRIRPRSRCFLAQGRRFSAQRTDLSSRFRSV